MLPDVRRTTPGRGDDVGEPGEGGDRVISQEALEFYASGTTDHPDACDMARELLAARKVIEAARDHDCFMDLPCHLCEAIQEYDEATR